MRKSQDSVPAALSSLTNTSFPPYPDLPDVFFYEVPDSNIMLKFINCDRRPDRNETQVQEVLVDAIMDSLRVDKYTPMPDYQHDWEAGAMVLLVTPEEEQQRTLTWTRWTTTLRGLRSFIRAYPGVDFVFEIYLQENQHSEWWIGIGQLVCEDLTSRF